MNVKLAFSRLKNPTLRKGLDPLRISIAPMKTKIFLSGHGNRSSKQET
jgi:hypothetical protein